VTTLKRLFSSIDFIEQSLFHKISVDTVAKSANYSTYHYCRIFKAIVGDSVMAYVRKRRLTEAADLLAKTDISVLEIAIQCQFESQETFTRAFKNQFNETPGKYRKINERFRFLYKKKFDYDSLIHRSEVLGLQPEIITKPELMVIGLSTIYKYDSFDVMNMWSVFKDYREKIPNMIPDTCGFGIYENYKENESDDSDTVFTYLCCVEVLSLNEIPQGMVGRTIPEQTYAVFTHKGMVDNMDTTLRYIWGDWLPNSQYSYANRPDFELYSKRFIHNSEKSELDLYIPINCVSNV